ncbi:metal-dependent hydrolase [Pistricoccus aurantiacus]|uniref:metal-dependent hydrolase n=1 Tax=Pistricoccus aurantiacus TaxID=1883414 RepID=UPI00362E099D
MDPVAHTLVGAVLAETGLKRLTRYATPTLIVGANLPDIDVIAHLWGEDASLYFRRGWSHGILALIVLPLLLACAIWLWHRWRRSSKPGAPPFRPGVVLGLSFLAVWTHPLLDWLNTYGVRLLMPFEGRWFYGDTLFIIDPWVWLLTAAGVFLARSKRHGAMAGWLILAMLASLLVLGTGHVPLEGKLLWCAALAALAILRWRNHARDLGRLVARVGVVALVIYACAAYGAARLAENLAAERFATPREVQANPLAGQPFSHRIVLVHDTFYRVVEANGKTVELPRGAPDSIVQAALESASIRGFVNWMRYPYWEVEESVDGWIVRFVDLRYQLPGKSGPGIGSAQVTVPKDSLPDR